MTEWNTPMVLTAKWDKIPEIELSKEIYLEQDLTTWSSDNNEDVSINNGIATINGTTQFFSGLIPVNGDKWHYEWDVFTSTVNPSTNKGYFVTRVSYYNSNKNYLAINCTYENGIEKTINLNEVEHYTWDVYGKNLQQNAELAYVIIKFDTSYPPIQISNVMVYGEAIPNSFYLININVTDDNDLVSLKYASGNQNIDYFENNGNNVVNNQIRVTENGIYTVYVKDSYGHEVVNTIEITNIE